MELSELLAPIPGPDPAGPSLRGEMLYREIQLARPDEPAAPRDGYRGAKPYARVAALASEALAHRSKDLWLAAWLAEAWTFQDGLPGLVRGLDLLRELLDGFWEHVHPALEDGDPDLRHSPLEWLDRTLPAAVHAAPLTRAGHGVRAYHDARKVGHRPAASAEHNVLKDWTMAMEAGWVSADVFEPGLAATPHAWLAARRAGAEPARSAVEALEAACRARFGEGAPRFTAVRDALDEYERVATVLLEKRQAAADAPADEEGGEAMVPAQPESPPTAAEIVPQPVDPAPDETMAPRADGRSSSSSAFLDEARSSPEEDEPGVDADGAGPPRSRGEAAARMAALARWLRAQAPADPAPYLMTRGFRWGELRAGGATPDPRLLSAPPTARRVRLKTLALEERWAELLEACEEVMASEHGRGWLDLQRYVATACQALGPEYDAMRQAVGGALRSLLHDLPALPGLTLMDDTPAANPETLAWLRESGIAPVEGIEEAAYAPPRAGRAQERARARAAAGEPERGVEILLDAAACERSPRARFLLRAQAAEVMVNAGLESVAAPLLRELAEQVERHTLEEWEAGDVVAHPLALLCRCMDRLGDGGAERGALYLRVCRLDPLRALHLREEAHAAA